MLGYWGEDRILKLALSIHSEAMGKDIEFLNLCQRKGYRVFTVLCIVDDIRQIDDAIALYQRFRNTIVGMRLRAAAPVWNERKQMNKIFVSDMLRYLQDKGNTTALRYSKTPFGEVYHDGYPLKLVSWYDVNNIDLNDINGPPYFRANDGNVYQMLTAYILNERIGEAQNNGSQLREYQINTPIVDESIHQVASLEIQMLESFAGRGATVDQLAAYLGALSSQRRCLYDKSLTQRLKEGFCQFLPRFSLRRA